MNTAIHRGFLIIPIHDFVNRGFTILGEKRGFIGVVLSLGSEQTLYPFRYGKRVYGSPRGRRCVTELERRTRNGAKGLFPHNPNKSGHNRGCCQ